MERLNKADLSLLGRNRIRTFDRVEETTLLGRKPEFIGTIRDGHSHEVAQDSDTPHNISHPQEGGLQLHTYEASPKQSSHTRSKRGHKRSDKRLETRKNLLQSHKSTPKSTPELEIEASTKTVAGQNDGYQTPQQISTRMDMIYVDYTISEDHSNGDEVVSNRLVALRQRCYREPQEILHHKVLPARFKSASRFLASPEMTHIQEHASAGADPSPQSISKSDNESLIPSDEDEYPDALLKASLEGRERVVRQLLDAGADVNTRGPQNDTALYAASYGGYEQVVRLLLDANANVNTRGPENVTALHAASYKGHEQVVRLLLDAGADVNTRGPKNVTAVYAASYEGHERVVRLLLDAGAKINTRESANDTTLYAASYKGHEQVVQLLLDAGANANTRGPENVTALQVALLKGQERVVRLLLDAGADVDTRGSENTTTPESASQAGHT